MKNNKLIGYGLWVFALLVPFRMLFLNEMRPSVFVALFFVLTIACLGVGALFFANPFGNGSNDNS